MSQAIDRERAVRAALQELPDSFHLGVLSGDGAIDSLSVAGDSVFIAIRLRIPARRLGEELRAAIVAKIRELPWVDIVTVDVQWSITAPTRVRSAQTMPQIKNLVAVASGKGGVGKSTTAVNLALALAHEGAAVGILDADIYGPSQPLMLGLSGERPSLTQDKKLVPPSAHGVKGMSIGFLVDDEQPMVWRGPMATQALNQLLMETDWGALDYLIIDMPPGTGDVQLTLSQRVPLSGAIIVTTPQDIALLDARKGLRMFQKVDVPVLGIVENMSTHICSQCGHEEHIFGAGGGRRMAEQYGVQLLGELPLDIRIREQADGGTPTVVAEPDSRLGRTYIEFARRTALALAFLSAASFPTITVEAS
jgi:ATP-binding protein involved in chromosome partitioning